MKRVSFYLLFLGVMIGFQAQASKLVYVKVVDKDMLMLYFKDGDAEFLDDASGANPYDHSVTASQNQIVYYGTTLNTTNATTNSNYSIKSSADANFGATGVQPTSIFRRSKICGMSQENWNTSTNDFDYDYAFEHSIFIQLPSSLKQGVEYTIDINSNTNTDKTTYTFTYDIYNTKSESIKVNLVGYSEDDAVKAADLYMWLGDGGQRDFSTYVGNKVYVYDVNSSTATEVGTVQFWKNEAAETTHGHHPIRSDVWNVDFTGFNTPGTYRLVVEGVGCSEDFEIKSDVYYEPFKVSTKGFYYMRIGADHMSMTPVPRRPVYIPDVSPADCKVYITTMHPFHAQWGSFSSGDPYDNEQDWAAYSTGRENPNAYGGHSDALDWDRYLGHSMSIYDMLLPYFLTNGAIGDDDLGIYESGNGVPDIIDEARDEVDLWLRVRDGKGYGNGLTNPTSSNVLYQTANTGIAAWCNALNAAMLSNAYMISGHTTLMQEYRDSALNAFNYANSLSTADQMLDEVERGGMRGRDFRVSAAAYLYNITGDTQWEDILASESIITSGTTSVHDGASSASYNQMYACAAYLFTSQVVNYPTLWNNMKSSIIAEAKSKEANYILSRPSRRSSDNTGGWFQTEMTIQRCIIGHAIADDGADKDLLMDAILLEADWTLGRNPLNMIQMTTATTNLANKRSVENAYTSGWNDGTPGVHPGHTPYMNPFDWGGTMVMGNPSKMFNQSYPTTNWPMAEQYINTRYVYAHCEFTPQQTMRCKQALYGYLYGLGPSCDKPNLGADVSICGVSSIDLDANISTTGRTFSWTKDGADIPTATSNTLTVTQAGIYKVTTNEGGCVKSDQINVLDVLPNVNLGSSFELCDPAEVTLDAVVTGAGITYSWEKDGDVISGADKKTYNVVEPGTYTAIIAASGCASNQGSVNVTSSLLSVTGGEICAPGPLTLVVNESGGVYEWYDDPIAGTLVNTGDSYTPTISANTTFYVEDVSGVSAMLGKTDVGTGASWALGSDAFLGTDKINNITVSQKVTLESVDVYVSNNGTDVTINIKQNGTNVHSATQTALSSGKQTIVLGFELAPGDYTIDADGTSSSLVFEASGAVYPYEYTDYISFTYNEGWQSDWYGLFYNWQISSGNPCARTPVSAIIDPLSPSCSSGITQTINLTAGWNLISINVSPSVKTIETLFAGVDVDMIKNSDSFWKSGQVSEFNSLTAIAPGYGYLVKMNKPDVLTISGVPIETPNLGVSNTGWQLIGCPYQTATPLSNDFNSTNSTTIKNFEGFWEPEGSLNSITDLIPGKGYYLLGK